MNNFNKFMPLTLKLFSLFCFPVHGGWSPWKDWGPCTKTCESGQQTRERKCDSPRPEHGGRPCEGSGEQARVCNTRQCPSKILTVASPLLHRCLTIFLYFKNTCGRLVAQRLVRKLRAERCVSPNVVTVLCA